jgi:hypothetical protein
MANGFFLNGTASVRTRRIVTFRQQFEDSSVDSESNSRLFRNTAQKSNSTISADRDRWHMNLTDFGSPCPRLARKPSFPRNSTLGDVEGNL